MSKDNDMEMDVISDQCNNSDKSKCLSQLDMIPTEVRLKLNFGVDRLLSKYEDRKSEPNEKIENKSQINFNANGLFNHPCFDCSSSSSLHTHQQAGFLGGDMEMNGKNFKIDNRIISPIARFPIALQNGILLSYPQSIFRPFPMRINKSGQSGGCTVCSK
jgi:hypothetical protein